MPTNAKGLRFCIQQQQIQFVAFTLFSPFPPLNGYYYQIFPLWAWQPFEQTLECKIGTYTHKLFKIKSNLEPFFVPEEYIKWSQRISLLIFHRQTWVDVPADKHTGSSGTISYHHQQGPLKIHLAVVSFLLLVDIIICLFVVATATAIHPPNNNPCSRDLSGPLDNKWCDGQPPQCIMSTSGMSLMIYYIIIQVDSVVSVGDI